MSWLGVTMGALTYDGRYATALAYAFMILCHALRMHWGRKGIQQ